MLQHWRRAGDLLRAARLKRVRFDPVLRWTPERLAAHQERRWRAVARLAAERAPLYRELYRGVDPERAPLRDLPPVDKALLMGRFDEAVTDPALRLADLEAFLRAAGPDDLFRGRFRALLTSGSTGRRGVIVYDREEWVVTLAASLRGNQVLTGDRPFRRLATLTSTHPSYISGRLLRATDLGFPPRLTLDPEEPLGDVLPRLERFRPEVLFGYPSAIAPIARAQVDGRARLRPRRVIGAGEAVTPEFREAVRAAWGREVEVLDLYATTETGALAVEAPGGRGRYLLEDATLVEVVDGRGRPVPDGERGDHLLITCLDRTAQPLIRYRVSDRLVLDPPGGAGHPPFRRVRAIEGRREDALRLENGRGERVEVHPALLLGALLELPGVRQVHVVQEVDRIEVSLVAAGDRAAELPAAAGRWFEALARERDLRLPRVVVRVVPRLGGGGATMGKFRPVECRLPA
jgi:phenylacetate-coenzyme A ligase PaaK-like adenylate-forming protein